MERKNTRDLLDDLIDKAGAAVLKGYIERDAAIYAELAKAVAIMCLAEALNNVASAVRQR